MWLSAGLRNSWLCWVCAQGLWAVTVSLLCTGIGVGSWLCRGWELVLCRRCDLAMCRDYRLIVRRDLGWLCAGVVSGLGGGCVYSL